MYLKSLVLKGFKSFADRSALVLEPGITAIVGPNGSGKSNISDAVLWVLGERSARNLRGQAMEDIIFSGSAARKAVSVAEVDLVLDNSDHTLPVEFDEVVITRRMYRSGESEYLVNGVVSRRLDVLDILHDTGLGTGTHSIISQGSLDSILQSKPEDRRALIEEAAGVLKHKQRKAKSARKLEAMDNHLARVRDVAAEVSRQLGPLERKAKRAKAHAEASAELADLRLALAVDDLRTLQAEWEKVLSSEKEVTAEIEAKREVVSAAEQKVNDFQEVMKRESEDAGTLARQQRRASSLGERIDGSAMLLRERRRAALTADADLHTALETAHGRRAAAEEELARAKEQLEGIVATSEAADAKVTELAEARDAVERERLGLEEAVDGLSVEIRRRDGQIDDSKRKLASMQESLANGLAQAQLVQARKAELESDLEKAVAEHVASSTALDAAKAALVELQAREEKAQEELIERFEDRDAAHGARDAARESVALIEAEIKAIEAALIASREDDPALQWLVENGGRFGSGIKAVSKGFRVSQNLERLVENLLGDDLASLAVDDASCAAEIADALHAGGLAGNVSVVMRADSGARRSVPARASAVGKALVDELSYSEDMAPIIEALLGDVVVCENRAAAFKAHAASSGALRFASPDGCAIWPSGKVRIYGASELEGEGVIARERRLAELQGNLEGALKERDRSEQAAEAADEAYRTLQVETLKLSQQLANSQGACESAQAEEERALRRCSAIERDIEETERKVALANERVGSLQPDLDALEATLKELEVDRSRIVSERDVQLQAVEPLREKAAGVAEKLTEAKLEAATLAERRTYVERIVIARERDIEEIDEGVEEQKRTIAVKAAVVKRCDVLLSQIESLADGLRRRVILLDEAVSASESAASNVHAAAAAARDDARRAHDDYDAVSERATQVRVEKSRLEIRVEAAVNVIVRDLGVPIDHAQELPPLDDRTKVEDDAFRLQRRIKNMGNISPDAAEEYAELKERYDFLAGQLADMEAARRSLNRITRVIDERMKDDFLNTYKQVNANFGEIFSLLFPGGQGYLTLEDPDDIDNTGVEVTAQPRGKRLTKMMLMSGGEKSLTALALLFAVYKTRTTPFYILDEVEAALDDTNLRRLIAYIDTLRASTQLIMITHQRRTMEMADVLFGVSMQADGVTKVISQKLERALEQAE